MPLNPRFLHWLQAADDALLSPVAERYGEAVDEVPIESHDAWEARARMIAAANAALRAEEERAWPSS